MEAVDWIPDNDASEWERGDQIKLLCIAIREQSLPVFLNAYGARVNNKLGRSSGLVGPGRTAHTDMSEAF